ncbi:MAG: glycosyltransferase family 4 protein [Cyanobacteria bacterium P01_D01_bin.156]
MKVLHLSTSDLDGGAARAAFRLHQGLRCLNVDSQMLVRAKDSGHSAVIAEKSFRTQMGPRMNGVLVKRYKNRNRGLFSPQWFPDKLAPRVRALAPDVVTLHWICNGFLRIETLNQFTQPVVWLAHDMWPFTGGCHYAQDCDRYTQSCGQCPQLKSQVKRDLSNKIWQRKANAWRDVDLTLVAPSHWFASLMAKSSLFQDRRIEVIPHGLDLEQYYPIEPTTARSVLRLPQDKQILLFGASSGVTNDPRKGFQFLQAALQELGRLGWSDRLEVVIFGIKEPDNPPELGLPTRYLGRFRDELSLVLTYSAADVMVVPSMQESFGQTASEALACATPVVAFNATGLKDIVDHQQTGYLANPYEVEDLLNGILWVLENPERQRQLSHQSREHAEKSLSLALQATRYEKLYEELIKH